ncbi:putative RNA-binding protein (virulence factor B family) [Paenibacillus sp. V4I3]|uniref:RNA-binding protein n=1 Tax=Paenibacillus phytorum TaxID=2654977 RepID=A0ABX1XV38_9BACL|nr:MULTISPECIES: S1-like domain-containing RNA-binding protein [Paenibacillus]MDQ0876997.1 putative RNA-binding protein (virulence factor B family) [Paenibacillus sp. V4I3]MDQ0887124.1 putative RNA-binding protein (virulence factor B family) [Paenibacillus sp. V4I9]NOU72397.1 RNA-binding protein [Paenibacillus phytorum]
MRMEAGSLVTLEVAREVPPNGYFLTDGQQDVLLPYAEIVGKIQPGDHVEAFLFHDTQDRLMATMKRPLLLMGEVGLLEVVDIHPRFGYFLEMGLGRNLLLPYRHVPELEELRPQVGDKVFATLAHDRQERLIAKLALEEDLAPLCVRAPSSWNNQWVKARVYRPLQIGTFVICEAGVLGYGVIGLIAAPERTRLLRVGELVEVRVAFVREEDGRVNLSMRLRKEKGMDEDSERILSVLQERPGNAMPFSDKTSADVIKDRFGLSKAAFKRALGKLMKDGLIYQEDDWTYLKQEETQG